ncbi:hypothetical protein [Niallia sp. NCCP-28]|uniref:hypothetical protein n=1 Tax=Niallia sp. NCCP-28 TaxID=2934712 RepID=UPI002089BD76|nr:hypothetical protein [Niallia sp. NCCP-28]GKU82570.1 hypothetical protein NCCP28_19660 [Niallia sp. NCCP-28]
MTIKMVTLNVQTGNNPILFITYNRNILSLSQHAIYSIDTSGNKQRKNGETVLISASLLENDAVITDKIKNGQVTFGKLKFPIGELFHKNSLEVNLQTKKAKVINVNGLNVFNESGYSKYADYLTEIDISIVDTSSYYTYFIYIDLNETVNTKLKVANAYSITSNNILVLFKICHDKFWCNESNVKLINSSGVVIDPKEIPAGAITYDKLKFPMAYMFGVNYNSLEINFQTRVLTIKETLYVLRGNGYVAVSPTTVAFPEAFTTGATYKVYVDLTDNTLKMATLSTDTGNNPIVFVTYREQIMTVSPQAMYVIDGNGKRVVKIGEVATSSNDSYVWNTNKIVMPKDLFIIKDLRYAINAPNFNLNKFTDNDRILYEMTTPTHTISFENSGSFSIPIAKDFKTLITGVYNGDTSNALMKDVTLRVVDPSLKTNKSPVILAMGDSTTKANIATLIKLWLSQYGFTPKMIGHTADINEFGYGFSDSELELAKSGALSGWRITDLMGITRDTSGNVILKDNNPYWNPATQSFDFAYYMQGLGETKVDFVSWNMGINDIVQYHGNPNAEKLTINEICEMMPIQLQKIIDSILAFNPNCRIGLNPPIPAGTNDATNAKYMQYALKMMEVFEGTNPNVDILSSYLGSGRLSGKTWGYYTTGLPDGRKATSGDVHDAGNNQTIHALWTAGWIAYRSI